MKEIMPFHDPSIDNVVLSLILSRHGRLLDVGCGYGWFGYKLRVEYRFNEPIIGFDIYKPYIEQIKHIKVYEDFIVGDARYLPFRNGAFDIVLAAEIIEHLDKRDGLKLIRECERVSRELTILTTPRGFYPQNSYGKNPFEIHRSGWTEKDFCELGFTWMFAGKPMITTSRNKVTTHWIFSNLLNMLPKKFKRILPKENIVAFKSKSAL